MAALKSRLLALWPHRPTTARLARLVMGVWLVSLVLGMLVPVYSDEIGWRFQERAGIDGLDKAYAEHCGPQTLAIPPWFMWPVRWYSAFFNTALPTPIWTRASGVTYALVWAFMAFQLIRQMAPDLARRRGLQVLFAGLMGLGTLPLQLVWSRPEQPILLALTAAMLVAWQGWNATPSRWAGIIRVAALVALYAAALSYHFKALILIPLVFACLALCDRQRRTWPVRAAGMAAVAVLSWQGAAYWFTRFSCPADPIVAAQHAQQSLHYDHSAGVLANLWHAIANYNLPDYITQAAPDITPMAHWLPAYLVSKPEQILWCVVMILIWLVAILIAFASAIAAGKALWQRRQIDPRLVFAAVLFCTASGWCILQKVRNVYEAALVLPLLGLTCVCALAVPGGGSRLLAGLVRPLAGALLISQVLVAAIYGPALVKAAVTSPTIANQPLSVSVAPFGPAQSAILAAASLCHIRPEQRPARLLLDEQTYYPFMQSPLPQFHIAVLDPQWNGTLGHDPLAYLRAIGSGGAVLQCRHIPATLRPQAKVNGEYCCLSPQLWQN